jgi:hypothetical protein
MLLFSCNKPTESESLDDFNLTVTLTNSDGIPLSGYKASVFQKDWEYFTGYGTGKGGGYRPATVVLFNVKNACTVKTLVTDYFDRPVRVLTDEAMAAGRHQVLWNGMDDDDNIVRDGVYKIKVSYSDGDSPFFTDFRLAYKLSEINIDLVPYETDVNGQIISDNVIPFPKLYCIEPMHNTDEMGNELGEMNFSATSDTMEIVISDAQGNVKYAYFKMHKGANIVNLNWDEMTSGSSSNHEKRTPIKSSETRFEATIAPKEPPLLENRLECVYPNPFN